MFIQSDEAIFMNQTKNNDRFYRLQEQVVSLKSLINKKNEQTKVDFERKLNKQKELTAAEFNKVEQRFGDVEKNHKAFLKAYESNKKEVTVNFETTNSLIQELK